jgi:hypothetical protein
MTKPQICILIYLVWVCIALGSLVAAHGGLAGDFDRQLINTRDPHGKNVHAASLAFNRWRIHFASEPIAYKVFVTAHAPADIVGRLVFKVLQVIPRLPRSVSIGPVLPKLFDTPDAAIWSAAVVFNRSTG